MGWVFWRYSSVVGIGTNWIPFVAVIAFLLSCGIAIAEPQYLPPQSFKLGLPHTDVSRFREKIVLRFDRGGIVEEHKQRWRWVAAMGQPVEIRGICWSACTQVVSYVPRERLCFDEHGGLAFHLARNQVLATGEWIPNNALTKAMVDSYPADIRRWIDSRGGYLQLPWDSYWVLSAPELWAMGYPRCS